MSELKQVVETFEKAMRKYADKSFEFKHESSSHTWYQVYDMKLDFNNGQIKLMYKGVVIGFTVNTQWELLSFLAQKAVVVSEAQAKATREEFMKRYRGLLR